MVKRAVLLSKVRFRADMTTPLLLHAMNEVPVKWSYEMSTAVGQSLEDIGIDADRLPRITITAAAAAREKQISQRAATGERISLER